MSSGRNRNRVGVEALDRLKGRRKQEHAAASQSHLDNDRYMDSFAEGLRRMEIGNGSDAATIATVKAPPEQAVIDTERVQKASKAAVSSSLKAELASGQASGSSSRSVLPAAVADGWISGPINETGSALDVSDRPILCSAAHWEIGEVVLGCSDHALYVLDVQNSVQKRQLYGSRSGHQEWVTCVTYLQDGSILSGGMDSRLCLWSKGTSRSRSLEGHTGSISQVCSDQTANLAISASYDKTIRLWTATGKCQGCLQGHIAPILELQTDNLGRLISGDRSGTVRVWDVGTGICTWELLNVHKGHITALAWADAAGGNSAWLGCFATGGQDGSLRLWDPRAHDHVAKCRVHMTKRGVGAVSGIIVGGAAAGYMTATCGADHTLRLLDARGGLGELVSIEVPDYPYSFSAAGGMILVGCGNGVVQVVDSHVMQTQYCLAASDCAIRTIQATSDHFVCAGDAGCTIFYSFATK
eukprot:jgi/Ulvmu1/8292/UM041_0104.1